MAIVAAAFIVTGCVTSPGYLLKQGGYLLKYSSGARPIAAVLADAGTSEREREFLTRVTDIRRFAIGSIGLRDTTDYTSYRKIDRAYMADVVQACDAVSFTPWLWNYPFLGALPYRGFYERADAEAEAARVGKLGNDVIIRKVDAFSTLGFLKTPLYSFMLGYSTFDLASTIIHEQTHATLFLRGQDDFNEEFASFVGDTGAFAWIRGRYGEDSPEYRAACDAATDADTFTASLRGLAGQLRPVYADASLSREEKLARKAAIIAAWREEFDRSRMTLFRTADYRSISAASLPVNNAYLSLYALYSDDVPLLRTWYAERCGSDLRRFIASVRELAATKGKVKELMRARLGGDASPELPK